MKSKKQKRIEALERMEYRLKNPVPVGQDTRPKKYPLTADEKLKEYNRLLKIVGRDM